MIYTFKVHYDDGESLESVQAESRLRALKKLKRRHEGARYLPLRHEYDGAWTDHPSATSVYEVGHAQPSRGQPGIRFLSGSLGRCRCAARK
jgi:hypothetical protein